MFFILISTVCFRSIFSNYIRFLGEFVEWEGQFMLVNIQGLGGFIVSLKINYVTIIP
jgi:hypothetical protein